MSLRMRPFRSLLILSNVFLFSPNYNVCDSIRIDFILCILLPAPYFYNEIKVRLATQQQARHAQQEHARSVEAQAARHQHHCQQLEQRRAAEDEQVGAVLWAFFSGVAALPFSYRAMVVILSLFSLDFFLAYVGVFSACPSVHPSQSSHQARQVVRAQCSSVRANLDQRVLAALERKCQNEASMVINDKKEIAIYLAH